MTQKHLARKIQNDFDLKLAIGDLEFLGIMNKTSYEISKYVIQYLKFLESRKGEETAKIANGVFKKFLLFLDGKDIKYIDEITVKTINDFIDWLTCAPKTIKNYKGVISLFFDQAIKEELIKDNPTKHATLPKIVSKVRHRLLEPIDLKLIFESSGKWDLYYQALYLTGLRAGDVALLKFGNINRKKKAIIGFVRKGRRIHEFPLADTLLEQIQDNKPSEEPIFPELYTDIDKKVKDRIAIPRKYLQSILEMNNRPHATLHSFRVTYNNSLRDLGLSIEDRQILLAHSSSSTTKIYTHPNFELAREYVNMIQVFGKKIEE